MENNNVQDEIMLLKNKIELLENQKLLDEIKYKQTNITYNIQELEKFIQTTKNSISTNRYSKQVPLARWYDQRLISYLEPIYNLLKITNERLDKIETYIN